MAHISVYLFTLIFCFSLSTVSCSNAHKYDQRIVKSIYQMAKQQFVFDEYSEFISRYNFLYVSLQDLKLLCNKYKVRVKLTHKHVKDDMHVCIQAIRNYKIRELKNTFFDQYNQQEIEEILLFFKRVYAKDDWRYSPAVALQTVKSIGSAIKKKTFLGVLQDLQVKEEKGFFNRLQEFKK